MGSFLFLYAFLRLLIDSFRDYEGGWLGIGQGQYFNVIVMTIGLGTLIWAMRDRPAAPPRTIPGPRRVNPLLVALFIVLCLYPLGIPTSWTRANIEEKRLGSSVTGPARASLPAGWLTLLQRKMSGCALDLAGLATFLPSHYDRSGVSFPSRRPAHSVDRHAAVRSPERSCGTTAR